MTITGEILLWRAVIDRAARDAFGCTDSNLYRYQALRWFFQKSPQSFCFVCDLAELDPDAVRKAITSKTKCVMPVHMCGSMADLDALKSICKENDLILLEDAFQDLLVPA